MSRVPCALSYKGNLKCGEEDLDLLACRAPILRLVRRSNWTPGFAWAFGRQGQDGDVGLRDVLFFSQGLRTYQPPTAAVAKLINFDSTCVELCRA